MRKGFLKIIKEDVFRDALKNLSDGNYKIVIEKIYNKRSNPQNSYLWGVVYPIVKEGLIDAGFDEFKQDFDLEMTHEMLKLRFLKRDTRSAEGNIIVIIGSTRKLSTVDFMAYLENICKWASEYLNVVIPDPEPEQYIEINEL
jgi:hypothetical protein